MSLPNLDVLNITLPWRGFPLMEFSKMKTLTSLKLNFIAELEPNTAGIFDALKMMPKLQNIDFCFDEISKESQLQLICDVVRAAILQ